ncbi:MAG: hypothetical protein QOJ79_1621 [Actinomycetota bacterium]|jgi:hypothetical protein|nr:hypothetical protein [Actinomycetota bacterium]
MFFAVDAAAINSSSGTLQSFWYDLAVSDMTAFLRRGTTDSEVALPREQGVRAGDAVEE